MQIIIKVCSFQSDVRYKIGPTAAVNADLAIIDDTARVLV